ncbi:hypothetical protein DESA109040_17630 [Deinococcus saxicola]|uniref:hypothetical protein n=1 Tax=Deinococcus saxicola TaxID=249406 RepID=UPI0039EEB6AD
MHLLRQAHPFEYRTVGGLDAEAHADLWITVSGSRAVLVLSGCPLGDAAAALNTLHHTWLPYLLRPNTQMLVLALHPRREGVKARALVLPLSA